MTAGVLALLYLIVLMEERELKERFGAGVCRLLCSGAPVHPAPLKAMSSRIHLHRAVLPGTRSVSFSPRSAPAPPRSSAPTPAAVEPDFGIERARRFGHSLERLAAPAGGAVIQAKIEWKQSGKEVDPLVERYNETVGHKIFFGAENRREALGYLHQLERYLYGWFAEKKSPDLDENPEALRMKSLMNEVQKERIDLVERSINAKDAAPPVASLNEENQERVTGIWNRLLANKDIRIEETGDDPEVSKPQKGFRTKVLADFSRLLETEAGRDLVGGIQTAGGGLTIKPTTMAKGKFAARSLDPDSEGLRTVPAPAEEHQQDFAPIDVNGMAKQEKIGLFHNIKTLHPNKRGFALNTDAGTQHFEFGPGSNSELKFPVEAKDAMPHPSSRGVDSQGNEILSPTFVNLGHELGHVLRARQGVITDEDAGRELFGRAFPGEEHEGRVEEFFNIPAAENPVREQSGISSRPGHGNLMLHQGLHHMQWLEKIQAQIARLGQKNIPEVARPGLKQLAEKRLLLEQEVQKFLKQGGDSVGLHKEIEGLAQSFSEIRQKHEPPEPQPEPEPQPQLEPEPQPQPQPFQSSSSEPAVDDNDV
jgi:hypothetical protein